MDEEKTISQRTANGYMCAHISNLEVRLWFFLSIFLIIRHYVWLLFCFNSLIAFWYYLKVIDRSYYCSCSLYFVSIIDSFCFRCKFRENSSQTLVSYTRWVPDQYVLSEFTTATDMRQCRLSRELHCSLIWRIGFHWLVSRPCNSQVRLCENAGWSRATLSIYM